MNLPDTLVEDATRHDALFPAIDEMQDGDLFIELGTFLGGNLARCVLYSKEKGKNIKFYAVDNFAFDNISKEGKRLIQEKSYLEAFLNGMIKCNVMDNIICIQGNTTDKSIVSRFDDNSISCLFLDDEHQYPYTKTILELWLPKVKKNGYIVGHDWPCDGVKMAVGEVLGKVENNGHSYWKYL